MNANGIDLDERELRRVRARHEAIYASPFLPRFATWPVADRIRVGRNPLSEADVLELVELGITHVLDLRQPSEWSRLGRHGEDAVAAIERHGLVRHNVRIEDVTAPTREHFDDAHAFIQRTLASRKHRLYTHCRAGIERTATILAACLGRRWRASFDEALERLRDQGWSGNPMFDQREAAIGWMEGARSSGEKGLAG